MPSSRTLVAALLLALAATACQRTTPQPQASPKESPVRGGRLVVALSQDPGHLNPAVTTSGAVHPAAELMFNGLVSMDEKGNPVPELAESLPKVESGGAVYRFTLREAKWHDGKPVTAGDVKFTFDQMLLQFHGRTSASMKPALDVIEAPDDRTVVFKFKRPYSPILQQLDVTEAPILPRHVYEGTDFAKSPGATNPVGSGPFKFVSYTKGQEVKLARNADYFKPGLPYFDEVTMRIIPDPATQLLAFENGEVDYVLGVPGQDQARLKGSANIVTYRTGWNPGGANCIMTMSFNLDRPILKELRVRQAIAAALNRQQFLDQVIFGEGRVADAPISSGIPWAHATGLDMPKFDAARAEQLLDAAGWKKEGSGRVARGVTGVPDGTKLALEFLHFPAFAKYGELVKQQLGAVGIEITQKPLEPAAFPDPVFVRRDFDTNIISYCNGTDPEIGVRRMYTSDNVRPAPFTNAAGYRNPAVDTLFDQASAEVDRTKRGALYKQVQEAVVKDLPYMWVVETVATRAWRSNCAGFKGYTGLFAEEAYCKR